MAWVGLRGLLLSLVVLRGALAVTALANPGDRQSAEPLMTVRELSAYLRVPVATIYQWRTRNVGPVGIRVGRHLRFRHADVAAYLEQHADTGVSVGKRT